MRVLSRIRRLFFAEEDIDQTAAVYTEKLRDYVEESDYAVSFNVYKSEKLGYQCTINCGYSATGEREVHKFGGSTPVQAIELFEKHLEETNHARCDICGKVFTGENAGQKVGGHKRTHRDG